MALVPTCIYSTISITKKLQHNLPKMRGGGSKAFWNFSKKSSDLVEPSFPKTRMLENVRVGNCNMATVSSVYPSMLFWMWNLLILRNLNYDQSAYWKIHANAEGCQTIRTHWSLDPHYQMWVMGKGVEKLMSISAKYKKLWTQAFYLMMSGWGHSYFYPTLGSTKIWPSIQSP